MSHGARLAVVPLCPCRETDGNSEPGTLVEAGTEMAESRVRLSLLGWGRGMGREKKSNYRGQSRL